MHIRAILSLATLILVGCAHHPIPRADGDGGKGTRVTNPRIAPWAFYRGDRSLLVGEAVAAGDVVETACAHDACSPAFRHLSVWQLVSGRPVARLATTYPDRDQRIKLAPGARHLIVAWTRRPLEEMPTIDLEEGTRKGPHTQTTLFDEAGAVAGVVQWGPVDEVR